MLRKILSRTKKCIENKELSEDYQKRTFISPKRTCSNDGNIAASYSISELKIMTFGKVHPIQLQSIYIDH
jgi:hypothetical protein